MGEWKFPNEGCLEKPNKMYYHTMTKKDVEERLKVNDIIIIPVGSTENHGNAGPMGEDTFIVTRIAEMVAAKTGCTIASPLWYGSHPFHHIGQPGTVPLPDDVFSAMIRAIISGYWNTGFRKQIFISMHGQEYIIPSAIQEWGKKYQVPALILFVDLPRVMGQTLMDKEHGGPFETPFQHADEAETSISLALFPEFCDMENAEDTTIKGYLPAGHVDSGGDIYGYPIPGHCQVGNVGIECITAPEGVLGKATKADPNKAKACIERACDYLFKLHNDILSVFPPGKLPDAKLISQRDPEEIEALLKGPTKGGKHIYTIAWPS
ncbi:3-dehydro-scyllo-inosose hydrolase [Thermovenabulum gondwanense]|uniref:Creatinine amidohydrolase n=1 Tax=Thermovenabulum gondwanense TaxID=520767 RepID=A0A162MXE6_9FIRM|nr:3-dehydro-scyllo-inosose hydrolase [Thermovenabulum gondwanense]KYO68074.1 Creatinine amidohydrolase [Thermovenabulum gondwanense]